MLRVFPNDARRIHGVECFDPWGAFLHRLRHMRQPHSVRRRHLTHVDARRHYELLCHRISRRAALVPRTEKCGNRRKRDGIVHAGLHARRLGHFGTRSYRAGRFVYRITHHAKTCGLRQEVMETQPRFACCSRTHRFLRIRISIRRQTSPCAHMELDNRLPLLRVHSVHGRYAANLLQPRGKARGVFGRTACRNRRANAGFANLNT